MPAAPLATPAQAASLLRLLTSLPGRRDDAVAVVNGLFGDALAESSSNLAIPMTIRTGGRAVPLDKQPLRDTIEQPTGRICVLVHGLMSTETVWGFPGATATDYGTLLANDHGVTPVYLRYNTGLHISSNGRELSRLLHDLVAAWPVPVRDITLIGHSMGGLIVRAACHYASATKPRRGLALFRRSWSSKVRRIILIGSPNTGSRIEELANLTSGVLWSFPIPAVRLVGLGLDTRSAGIRDLRFGAILDEDWQERDPSTRERPSAHPVRPVRRTRYLIVAGSVTTDPDNPVSQLIGDALVTPSSATGTPTDTADGSLFPGATIRVVPKINHLALAHRREVYDEIDEWFRQR